MMAKDWYEDVRLAAERAEADLRFSIERFIEDWSTDYGFRVEKAVEIRVKSQARIVEKCAAKQVAIEGSESILAADATPIGDVVGARLVVRTLSDLETLAAALLENFQYELVVEDLVGAPSETGYRAVHLNGYLEVGIRDTKRIVPFEIQIKTLAQDAWGYYTHDSVYVRRALRRDARFAAILSLQKILSDQLHVVDQMERELERLGEDFAEQIQREPADMDVLGLPTIINIIYEQFGYLPTIGQGDDILSALESEDLTDLTLVRKLLRRDASNVDVVADSFRQRNDGRSPTPIELVAEIIREHRVVLGE